jgi:prepilin-type N-terminal cleavage/methylation domain-containing protein
MKSGFTLLEIMIALAIIGIALTVILHTVNYHANIMYENSLITQMYQMAKEKMHQLEKSPQSAKGDIPTGFKYETTVSPVENSNLVELKTVVKGQGKEVQLRGLIVMKGVNKQSID